MEEEQVYPTTSNPPPNQESMREKYILYEIRQSAYILT